MNKKRILMITMLLCWTCLVFGNARANSAEESIRALTEEVQDIKDRLTGKEEDKLHFHGYAELHYNGTDKKGEHNEMDFHRMVIGLSYRFNDWIVFDTEVDFEHAAKEMELEYAHLSFLLCDAFNIRIGSMLMPFGYLNEFHEPPLFYSVERPYVQKYVIPTTWQEGGLGIFGSPCPSLNYRLYVVGGLDAGKFTASGGIRKGRGKVSESKADNVAGVGRVEYSGVPGLRLGVSGYVGDAAQGDGSLGDAMVGMVEGDLRYHWNGFELTGLVSSVFIEDTEKIFAKTGEVVGENILGWYVEGAFHVGKLFLPEGHDMVMFGRHERFDTQNEVAGGLAADPANDRMVTTYGLAYYPIPKVAVKADMELWQNDADEEWIQYNLGFGLMW